MVDIECPSLVTSTPSGIERRREPRFASSDIVPVMILREENNPSFIAELVDISRNGLGLTADRPLSIGSRIFVKIRSTGVFGVIMHCRRLPEGGFRAGVAIDLVVTLAAAGQLETAGQLDGQSRHAHPATTSGKAQVRSSAGAGNG